ncbi:glycoside hydrolase family 18 protein [Sporobolomyces salmoneus]|uniref:glycoside hydrolase family 18 protein n=1 Tax=Sporobolomyces salmoneus TaxID=183962 RepID=UPI00316B2BF6
MLLSLPTLVTLFTSITVTLAASSPARLDHSSSTHAPRSFSPRAAICPPKIFSQYYPAWTNAQTPSQIDWKRGDVVFYFASPTTKDGLALPVGSTLEGLKKFVAAAKTAGKKPGLTLGGWEGSQYFSNLVATVKNRDKFAQTVKTWVTTYGFTSVSFDWEFIGKQGAGNNVVRSTDAANLIKFFTLLRTTLGTGITISADVPAGGITGADGQKMTDLRKFAANLDYIALMTYDFYGPWSSTSGPHSALYTCNSSSYSIDQSVKDWTSWGVPACKLLLGVPGYSHRFKTASKKLATTTYNGSPSISFQSLASPKIDDATPTTKELVSQKLLSSDLSKGLAGYTRYFDNCTQTPLLFNPSSRIFITYEDNASFKAKGNFAKQKGLAGIAVYDSTGPTASMFNAIASGFGHA